MTQYLVRRARGLFILKLPGHLLILLFLWLTTSVKVWMVFFIAYLTLITLAFIYEVFRAWRLKRERIYAKEARRLMCLLRRLIDMAYVYDERPEKFYEKFLEVVSAPALSGRGIIDPDALLRTPKFNRMCGKMRREDAELWTADHGRLHEPRTEGGFRPYEPEFCLSQVPSPEAPP